MKIGRSLQELAGEIARQKVTKHDYVASTRAVEMAVWPQLVEAGTVPSVVMNLGDQGRFGIIGINDLAHDQIAEHVKIPKPYYERMRKEAPDLLATNVDRWFEKYPADRLLRTLDGKLRAFLSNSYRPLDNFDFASAILPVLADRNLEIMSCDITERRLYIKAVDTKLFKDVPVGYKMGDGSHRIFDTCAPAFIASNSEVGFGTLILETGVYTRACTNMALWSDGGMRRRHVGAKHHLTEGIENIDAVLSERTKQKTDEALWMQVRDVLNASFEPRHLSRRLERLELAAGNRIEGKVQKVVEVAATRFALNSTEQESVLRHLIEGGSLSQYGLHAAVTRTAQDAVDYDRATELEYLGGRIIELPQTEWEQISLAA